VYKGTSQRELIFLLVFITLLILILEWENISLRLYCILILLIQISGLFIKYSFSIEEDKVIYKIFLLNFQIYQKQAKHSTIKKVIFKRVGWKTKLALIKIDKGIPIRISLFTPVSIFNELIAFCEKNNIEYEKTKDYKILEKMA